MNSIIIEDINQIIFRNLPWQTLENKTIFLTGANGMLPAYLVYTIIFLNKQKGLNIKLLVLVRSKEKALNKFSEFLGQDNFKLLVQDVSQPIVIDEKIDIIIHAASQASPKYFGVDPVGTINANVLGVNNLLILGRDNNIENFLFFSTGEVYGATNQLAEIKEEDYGYIDILNVRSCYAESKRLAETMCVAWWHQYGIPVKIARIAHSYGPGMLPDDGRVFADFVFDVVNNNNIILKSDGSAKRPFCYISDCIVGLFTILFNGENGNAYNVANEKEYYSIKELVHILVGLFPEKKLTVEYQTPHNIDTSYYLKSPVTNVRLSVNKLMQLGWYPTIGVKAGFRRTIQSIL